MNNLEPIVALLQDAIDRLNEMRFSLDNFNFENAEVFRMSSGAILRGYEKFEVMIHGDYTLIFDCDVYEDHTDFYDAAIWRDGCKVRDLILDDSEFEERFNQFIQKYL